MIDLNANETTIMSDIINEPVRDCTLELYNHFGRYYYAAKKLKINSHDDIIDASCGCGYGSYVISQRANSVFGLDVNIDNLNIAKKHYTNSNILYMTYEDFFNRSFWANRIICLETLEHIPKKDINKFIDNLLSHLRHDGSMFVSIPLGNNEPSTYNQWHCNEMSIDVVHNLLSKYFKNINVEIDNYINSFGYSCDYCFLTLEGKK